MDKLSEAQADTSQPAAGSFITRKNLWTIVLKDMENFITLTEIDMKVPLVMELILAMEYIILL